MKKMRRINSNMRKGMAVVDFVLAVALIAMVIAGIMIVVYPKAKAMLYKKDLINQYQVIQTGLDSYYSDTNFYPSGSGWTWNSNNAYVPQDVVAKGWDYSCNSNTITLETPAISNKKILTSLETQLQSSVSKNNGSVAEDGNRIKITIPDKPCK